jgi:ParB-like chromosome segregation protein Spo0J
MNALELRTLPIDQLRPAPYNPRTELAVTSPAYRKLRASLAEFGLVEPLVWNETSGYVVGGHLRLRILAELGVKIVPVSVVRLSPTAERALNIVLNNPDAQGRYDPQRLFAVLAELEDLPELSLTGFDDSTLATLRFAPLEDTPATPAEAKDRVEITLITDKATYDSLASELDSLIGNYNLVAHVRHN